MKAACLSSSKGSFEDGVWKPAEFILSATVTMAVSSLRADDLQGTSYSIKGSVAKDTMHWSPSAVASHLTGIRCSMATKLEVCGRVLDQVCNSV